MFYLELSKATQVQRIGLRFVNRIVMSPPDLNTDNYLSGGPKPPEGLDFSFHNFMHHDTWAVPSHPFAINVIRAFQALPGQIAVILDIDVFSTVPFELLSGTLEKRLAEMRWLKNKTFFGIINPKQIEQFAIPK